MEQKHLQLSRPQTLLCQKLQYQRQDAGPIRKLLLHSQGAHGGDLGLVVRVGRARDVPGQAVGTQLQEQQKAGHPQRGLPQVQAGPGTPGRRPQNTHEGKHCEVHGSVGRSAEQLQVPAAWESVESRLGDLSVADALRFTVSQLNPS